MSSCLVVGAGISGSTIARLLAERGDKVTIIDKRDHVAGNCYDYRDENGIMVHKYGSHIFHTSDEEVWKFVTRFTEFNDYVHEVRGMIDGKEVPIPFNLNSLHLVYPKEKADRIENKLFSNYGYGTKVPILEFMKQGDEELRELAEYVYENVFLHYTMKQWGLAPDEIDCAVTARVPVFISRDNGYFQDKYQGIPINGYTEMISRMLEHENISVKLKTMFSEIDVNEFENIFYTGSIDELFDFCFGSLPYRSLRFEESVEDCEYYQSNSVINYPNSQEYTRIHEYKYYLNDRSDRTHIVREYPESFRNGMNERYYPILTEKNIEKYQKYSEMLNNKDHLFVLGRLGDYRYYNIDQAISRAIGLISSLN